MKVLLFIAAIFIFNFSYGQEPTPFGFNFKISDSKGKIITAGKFKEMGLQLFVTDMKRFEKCADGRRDSFPVGQLSYNEIKKIFIFDRIYGPSEICEPAVVLVRNKDTMFIKLASVLNYSCYQHLPNGSEVNALSICDKAFIIRFKKGYFVDYSPVETMHKLDLEKYFNEESAKGFCHWQEIK